MRGAVEPHGPRAVARRCSRATAVLLEPRFDGRGLVEDRPEHVEVEGVEPIERELLSLGRRGRQGDFGAMLLDDRGHRIGGQVDGSGTSAPRVLITPVRALYVL